MKTFEEHQAAEALNVQSAELTDEKLTTVSGAGTAEDPATAAQYAIEVCYMKAKTEGWTKQDFMDEAGKIIENTEGLSEADKSRLNVLVTTLATWIKG